MRIVIAEDGVLMREGLRSLLAGEGHNVVAQVGDADALRTAVREHEPDLAIIDVRMPPTQTDEGARAAVEIRAERPTLGLRLGDRPRSGTAPHGPPRRQRPAVRADSARARAARPNRTKDTRTRPLARASSSARKPSTRTSTASSSSSDSPPHPTTTAVCSPYSPTSAHKRRTRRRAFSTVIVVRARFAA
jgi:CheY-like chemotaxis protein